MSTKSWGHRVVEVEPERIQEITIYNARQEKPSFKYRCATRNCKGFPLTHYNCYTYVTGQRGRTTEAQRLVCGDCAAFFFAKYCLKDQNNKEAV